MATPPSPSAHANTVGWYILEGYPWWPVYICDQFKLRPHLYQLGDGHKKILKKAKDFQRDYALVYYFGSYQFSLVKLNKNILKPWDCSEKEQYLKGHPKHLMKKGTSADELKGAIHEAEDYLSQPEDMRLPPHMVPSDLDPTLEPPPPMERPEEDDEDMENEDDADGGDKEEDADGDADMEHEDEDGDGKASKKAKKTTKKSTKKDKVEKDKKPKKEKKEKKPPTEKPEKKTPTKEKKEKKIDTKKKSEDTNNEKSAKLKRQRSSGGDDAEGDDASKPKQLKKETAADVKNGASDANENMAEILDREIRWILSNEQYEEMTTKMLRKVLEERLKCDLKQHRDTIKAVVTRVIEEEEEAAATTGGDAPDPQNDTSTNDGDVTMVEDEAPVKNEPKPEPIEPSNETPSEPEKSTDDADIDAPMKDETNDVELKNDVEAKVEETKDTTEEKKVEVAPPKPVVEADILHLKDKLGDPNTSHDELLASLNELQQMPLEMSHLKQTGIARVVANLRQHANDKVSIAAKNLRNAWMQLAEKGKQPNNLKRLEKMNETLESETDSDAAKLSVLQKLDKLTLTTQEIIEAKIGVTISKLRKSSHADTAEAANKLRQKWKKLAASSTAS